MVNVIKANGEKEAFSEDKLKESIKRAGIPSNLQQEVIAHVKLKLYEDIPTSEVYKHITEFLGKEPHLKSRYSLKQAIMDLGPTGYPFEDYVAEILKAKGYVTQVRSILTGKCVNHEIDVIAEKENLEKLLIEAKFHNTSGIRTDVHVSLYTKARFDDLKDKYKFDKAYLFTNTKITSDALSYALCTNMGIVSWSYPQNESLRDLIEKFKLYPITIIDSLSQTQKQTLLENHIVLVRDICKNKESLDILGLHPDKKNQIHKEAELICKT
ncbi:MAG: restriction endonuclease [Patescibacteria group bacterium]|mgnify:CR=1 FL=1